MRAKQKTMLFTGIGISMVLGFAWLVLLFDGDLDFGGHYRILQANSNSDGKTAFEIERSDDQALSGLRYAVVVADHTPRMLNYDGRLSASGGTVASPWQTRT
jgi:hypothetical protein